MKKILWLCNVEFSPNKLKVTGGWLQPLAELIVSNGVVSLHNITLGNVKQTIRKDYQEIKQWVIPNRKNFKYGQIPTQEACEEIEVLIDQIKPDLVHIWGTESIWVSVYCQGFIKYKTLLDIQGLLNAYTDFYYGGLTFKEIMQSVNIKEVLMPWRTLFYKREVFRKRGIEEINCLKRLENISYQSNWVKNHLSNINPSANYFSTQLILRNSFYNAPKWQYKERRSAPVVFSSTSSAVSYKGIHVLIKAIAQLKRIYPKIQLRLAGQINVGNKLMDGYSVFLNRLIKKNNLQDNVILKGSLNADEMIEELLHCNVCVVPSFVETYCVALAEAMMVGVPVVVSYAGAMPELAEHNKEAMFYNSLDHVTCATYIDELIQNKEKAESLSLNARARRLKENDRESVVATQISIYKSIINDDLGTI